MAEDRQKPEMPTSAPVERPQAVKDDDRKVTENPGEGTYMFTDWALI